MTKDEAMAYLQALADDCSDGDQACAVIEAPLEVLAAALGGEVKTITWALTDGTEQPVAHAKAIVLPPQAVTP